MSWVATAVVAAAAVGGASAYSSSKAASKNKIDPGIVKDYGIDPLYKSSQEKLNTFGIDLLGGKLPDFYSSIGKTGSGEFNDMLAMVNRDTARAVQENNVRRGVSRGGIGGSSIAKAVANSSTTLRWSDFLRASGEKTNLLNMGINTLSGVRSSALSNMGIENQYNMQASDMLAGITLQNNQAQAAKDMMWSNILSSAIGSGSSAYVGLQGLGAQKPITPS